MVEDKFELFSSESEVRRLEDNEIVALYRCRDEGAIEETMKKYGDMLLCAAENVLQSREDALECVNDTYFQLWENICSMENKQINLLAYALKVNRYIAIKRLRTKNTQKRHVEMDSRPVEDLEEILAAPSDMMDDRIVIRDTLNAFIWSLGEQERTVFVGRYWYLEKESEIADKLGIKTSNVKVILHRCKEKLRKRLEEEGIDV
ncbi:MAG: sigma-70 family RNA polymerase sigma factor [Lachnospiraceae bacterium]|nr:sigma-70 family RNA polymerase sigma factor [Lachnospiraceae bacterium]